jgi:hypothetical protein
MIDDLHKMGAEHVKSLWEHLRVPEHETESGKSKEGRIQIVG